GEVDAGRLAEHDVCRAAAAEHLPERRRDLDRRERAGRDLVGERLEEEEVLAVDERDVDAVRAPQAAGGEQPGEPSADDDDPPAHPASLAPSSASRRRFTSSPPAYPVREPSAPTMRWHGSTIGIGLRFITVPTARAAAGRPTLRASEPSVSVRPSATRASSRSP